MWQELGVRRPREAGQEGVIGLYLRTTGWHHQSQDGVSEPRKVVPVGPVAAGLQDGVSDPERGDLVDSEPRKHPGKVR